MDHTLNKIFEIINWYRGLPMDFVDISRLIYLRKQLSTYSVDLASFVGELKSDYETAYFNRKLQFAKSILKQEGTVAEKEALATQDIKAVYEDEKTLEGQHAKAKLILSQVNEVLSSMQQHLSFLKDEKKSESIRQSI